MADRNVYGNDFSENGWRMVDQGSCVWVKVPGANCNLQIREGQPAAIMGAFAADFNAYVEPLRDADSACWTATNSVGTSNHLSGTAMDLNWDGHVFKVPDAGFNQAQIKTCRDLLDFFEGMIFWGNDWDNPKDAMHWQMGYDTYGSANVDKVNDFIRRKIRADGFSTFRRDGAPPPTPAPAPPPAATTGLTAETLQQAMGGSVSLDRYRELLPGVRSGLWESGCAGNLNRLAMWLAQVGHESGGLKYMEEIASGAAYEGRADLGNTQPGDGVRFKGHGPIQITGRHNHTAVSQWAFDNGYVPSPTYFVDNPQELAGDKYGFLGVVWYWTVARPNINQMCDAGDLEGVTRAINGGLNGITDRSNRWDRCRSMGLAALDVSNNTPTQGDDELSAEDSRKIDIIYQELTKKFPSRSPLRHVGEGLVDTLAGFVLNLDGSQHVEVVRLLASYGDPDALALLREIAGTTAPDRKHDAQLAQAILSETTKAPTPISVTQPVASVAPSASKMVYVSTPTPEPEVSSAETASTTGQIIGQAYDALEKLQGSGVLTGDENAPLQALIGVLQTKTTPQGETP